VSTLAKALDSSKIIHVRGTPSSGKSTLARLLRDYYRRHGSTVFLLPQWEKLNDCLYGDDPWRNFARRLSHRYPTVQKAENFFADGNVILIDEAQATYGDNGFWNELIKDISGGIQYNIRLCLFCSYGSPSQGLPFKENPYRTTPVDFAPNQRISLTPSGEPGTPPIGLFYNRDEFENVVTILCSSDPVERYSIDSDAEEYIFDFTSGHPGAVRSILHYLFNVRIACSHRDLGSFVISA
jgi:hypothetical protein